MTQNASSTELELGVVLPLGVLAQQLLRIEAQLRAINMKTLDLANDEEHRQLIGARLEHISDALDSIRALVADLSRRRPQPRLED